MQGISTFSWYPRGVYGLQNLGPGVAHGFITAGRPTRIVNGPGAAKATKPISNNFEFNPNTIKDSVGFKVSEPERIIHPNLKPSVNFSLPTSTRNLDALNLKEDINKDTDKLDGSDLLGKLVTYVSDLYKNGSSPFELSASPFQSLINACKRLNLNSDPTLAGLPRTVNQSMPFGTFVKVNIWLMGADQVFDKSLKPGYIYIAQQKVPVSQLLAQNRPKAYVLDLYNRRASVGVSNASMADIAEGPRLPDVGHMPVGGPNLADGRDGRQEVAIQDPVRSDREEVKSLLDVTARAVDQAADLEEAIRELERPEATRYSFREVVPERVVELQRPETGYRVVVPGPVEEDFPASVAGDEPPPSAADIPVAADEFPPILLSAEPDPGYNGVFPFIPKRHREKIYAEMHNSPAVFMEVFELFQRRAPARKAMDNVINMHDPDGQWSFPGVALAAERYKKSANGGYKNFIEMLMYIYRHDPFTAPNEDYWDATNLKRIKTNAFLDMKTMRAQLRQLREAVQRNNRGLAQRAVGSMLEEDDDGTIIRFIKTRADAANDPIELAKMLLMLNNSVGQVGIGKKRRKKPTKKKARARARPY